MVGKNIGFGVHGGHHLLMMLLLLLWRMMKVVIRMVFVRMKAAGSTESPLGR